MNADASDRIDDTIHVIDFRGPCSVYAIAEQVGVSVRTAIRHTRRLLASGRVERYVDGVTAFYVARRAA